ncbi:MAG: hypothetical protein JWN48_383 [Myxococcaceae bacterium]|nr:hypothetical protein [Myxococcaceae bacterium]
MPGCSSLSTPRLLWTVCLLGACQVLTACLQEPPPDYTLPRDAGAHGDAGAYPSDAGVEAGLDARVSK